MGRALLAAQKFQGDWPIELLIMRPKDKPHPALIEVLLDGEVSDASTRTAEETSLEKLL